MSKLPFGITVDVSKGCGSITSDLHDEGYLWIADDTRADKQRASGAADLLEAFLLALACAGVDIETPEFVEALETAVDGYAQN